MLTARIFLRFFLALYVVIAALLVVTYFTTPFYGDLTRIGLLPESLFGWRQPQPSVPASQLKSVKAADADVLVIGDSFSANMVWQSELVSKGLAVKTLHWTDFGSALCDNVAQWLKRSGFNNKGMVIIESVQRSMEQRLDASVTCRGTMLPAEDVERTGIPPGSMPILGTKQRNGTEKILTGITQLWNARLVKNNDEARRFGNAKSRDVPVARPVARGCEWFSHTFCSKALFIASDDAPPLNDASIAKIRKVNTTLSEYKVVWLVVPDKSTIYFEKDAAFWRQLATNSLGPNLYDPFLLARETTKDLYSPNDTHLSTTGFLLLGKTTGDYLAIKR